MRRFAIATPVQPIPPATMPDPSRSPPLQAAWRFTIRANNSPNPSNSPNKSAPCALQLSHREVDHENISYAHHNWNCLSYGGGRPDWSVDVGSAAGEGYANIQPANWTALRAMP
jgi:hypothetical protein